MGTIRGIIKSQNQGPTILCELSVSSKLAALLLNTGGEVPPPITCQGLIDTGAARTILRLGVGEKLNIPQAGSDKMIGASDSKGRYWPIYPINLKLESGDSFDVAAVEMPISFGFGIQCLIGRDILKHAVFVYIGNQDKFELTF